MKTFLLVAMLTFMDGTPGPLLPIDTFESYEACFDRANDAYDIVQQISIDWEDYMYQSGDMRPLAHVYLTCTEKESI